MPSHDLVVVSLIASAFVAFGITLALTIWYAERKTSVLS